MYIGRRKLGIIGRDRKLFPIRGRLSLCAAHAACEKGEKRLASSFLFSPSFSGDTRSRY